MTNTDTISQHLFAEILKAHEELLRTGAEQLRDIDTAYQAGVLDGMFRALHVVEVSK